MSLCELRRGRVRVILAGEVRQCHPAAADTLPHSNLSLACGAGQLGNPWSSITLAQGCAAAPDLCSGDLGEAEGDARRPVALPQTHTPPGQAETVAHSVVGEGSEIRN